MKFINIIVISLFFSHFSYNMEEYPINGLSSEYQELQPEPEEIIAPERISHLQGSAQKLSEIISEVQQKMASSRHLEAVVTAWEAILNRLQQVASLLQGELYAKTASKEQFKDFYTTFITLAGKLDILNKQLVVPEFKLHDSNPPQTVQLRQRADNIINRILVEISNAVKLNFFDNFKKIEKIYSSMTDRIKQEQEAKEEQSRAEQQQADFNFDDLGYYDYDVENTEWPTDEYYEG